MSLSPPAPSQASAALRFDYETTRAESLLHRDDVLAVFGFGAACPLPADARVLRVGLEPVGAAPLEVWRTSGPVRHGCEGDLRWSKDGDHLFFALELDEQAHAASRRRPTMPTGVSWPALAPATNRTSCACGTISMPRTRATAMPSATGSSAKAARAAWLRAG